MKPLLPKVKAALRARQNGVPPWLARNHLNNDEITQFEQVMRWLMYPERFTDELRAAGFKWFDFSKQYRRVRDKFISLAKENVAPPEIGPYIAWRLAA